MTDRLTGSQSTRFIMDDGACSATAVFRERDTAPVCQLDFQYEPRKNIHVLRDGYEAILTRRYRDRFLAINVASAGVAVPQSWKGIQPPEGSCSGARLYDAALWTDGPELVRVLLGLTGGCIRDRPKTAREKGTVPFCSTGSANSGQSPAVLGQPRNAEITRPELDVPRDVREFADRFGMRKQLDRAIQAVRRHFTTLSSIRAYLDWDPDDADEYIVVEANSAGDPVEDTQAYMNYLDEWSAATEWPASRMVRLDLNWPASNAKQ